jgi:hypothetical protein
MLPNHRRERIEQADRWGLRICSGALVGTTVSSIHNESNIPTYTMFELKDTLLHGSRLIFKPELHSNLDYLLACDRSHLVRSWHEIWQYYSIPQSPNYQAARARVKQICRRKKPKWKY